jgi:hypothetical protein
VSGDAVLSASSQYIIVPFVKDLPALTKHNFVLTLFNDKGKLHINPLQDWEEASIKVDSFF